MIGLETNQPTLRFLREQWTRLTADQIAKEAGLSRTDVYLVEIGAYCPFSHINMVLTAFNKLAHQNLTVRDIKIQSNRPITGYC